MILSQKSQSWRVPNSALVKVDKLGTFSDRYSRAPCLPVREPSPHAIKGPVSAPRLKSYPTRPAGDAEQYRGGLYEAHRVVSGLPPSGRA